METINFLDRNYNSERSRRLILESGSVGNNASLTVFVGLYNAEGYIDSLQEQIEGQTFQGCKIIVVDNDSDDLTWERVQPWKSKFGATLVKNPYNFGATGSLYLNLDLISTPWVTFMHQDDLYYPGHFYSLHKAIPEVDSETVTISTEMASIDSEGRNISVGPRAFKLLPDLSQQTLFLANVRQHVVPWPSSAFRVSTLLEVASPWHSSSFQDTEMMLLLCTLGKSHFVDEKTMAYRENPDSGSHELKQGEKLLGAALALIRVFNSAHFLRFIQEVDVEQRDDFSAALFSSIQVRLGDVPILSLVNAVLIENLQFHWGYKNAQLNHLSMAIYRSVNSFRTISFLDSLNQAPQLRGSKRSYYKDVQIDLGDLVGTGESSPVRVKATTQNLVRKLILKIGRYTPIFRSRIALRFISRIVAGQRESPWNFRWK